jgi:hypothetical protein
MTDDLIAYLLDDLAPAKRAQVEERLATDFAWQRELKRLQDCMAAGGDPARCAEEPPPDLVQKTCLLVEHSDDLPAAQRKGRCSRAVPVSAFTADAPCIPAASRPWGLADLTVGGGVLLMVGALVIPSLFETRDAARRSVCQSNLQQLGTALFQYQEDRDNYLPRIEPGEGAGLYSIELLEHSGLTREQLMQLLVCPESQLADDIFAGHVTMDIPTREEYRNATAAEREAMLKTMGGSIAFRLGYYENDELHQPRFTGEAGLPLLADAPVISPRGVRSGNHRGGHNVIDERLKVDFRTNCFVPNRRDNFYLNANGQPAAGRGPKDIVLVGSATSPDGPLGNGE